MALSKPPALTPNERDAIGNAILEFDLKTSPGWSKFLTDVPGVKVETVEPLSIFKTGTSFEASATLYVTIAGSSNVESFPASVSGFLKDEHKAEITHFDVSTSSFFEDSQFSWQSKTS